MNTNNWIKFTEDVRLSFINKPPKIVDDFWILYRSGDTFKVDRGYYHPVDKFIISNTRYENGDPISLELEDIMCISKIKNLPHELNVEYETPIKWYKNVGENLAASKYKFYWAIIKRDPNQTKEGDMSIFIDEIYVYSSNEIYIASNLNIAIKPENILYYTLYTKNKPKLPEVLI